MQIFVGSDSLDVADFYPDDLPNEWRFDYYNNAFFALKLACDTNEDLDEVLENIDEDFRLIVDITNTFNLDLLLAKLVDYKENIILFSESDEHFAKLKQFNFCLTAKVDANNLTILNNNIYYNSIAVITVDKPEDEKEIRTIVEELLKLKTEEVVLLLKNADSDSLEKTKIIVDLLS
jgi:hypothetical protein